MKQYAHLNSVLAWQRIQCLLAFFLLLSHPKPSHCVPVRRGPTVSPLTVQTNLGTVTGLDLGNGVARFTLPFAMPPVGDLRFANPQPIKAFSDAGSAVNVTQLPPQCYQDVGVRGGTDASEDCLYVIYYVPIKILQKQQAAPMLVWFHGGSGIVGGASQQGLDGSTLANQQSVIVAVPQYRLGLFGWLQSGASLDEQQGGSAGGAKLAGNQAMRDMITALQQVQTLSKAFHGDEKRVTVLGQSSGAIMVRALLNMPSAQSLFNNVVTVSDPNDYGFSSIDDNNALGESGLQSLGCKVDDVQCARSKSADDILQATYTAYSDVPQQNERISSGTPWRPMVGSLISASHLSNTKSAMLTTVQNELGSVAGSSFAPTPQGDTDTLMYVYGSDQYPYSFADAANLLFNNDRGAKATQDTDVYAVDATIDDGLRIKYEELGTDGIWRCGTQSKAVQEASTKRNVYLAEVQIGSTYSSNAGIDYCTTNGRVCHEDDILLIFGTMPNGATDAQKRASKEMQTRIANFARTNTPLANGAASWQPVRSAQQLNLLVYNADGTSSIAQTQHAPACAGSLWGNTIKFDYQLYPAT